MAQTPDPDGSSTSRRAPIVVLVALVVLAAIGLGAWALSNNRSDDTDDPMTAAASDRDESADRADDATSTTATGSDPAPSGPDGTAATAPPVELAPVAGGNEAELCAAIVERLGEYRAVAADGGVDQTLVDALDEFEAQVDTQSDDQDWGDRIIEQLTNVRREWITALSAQESGDAAAAADRFEAALGHLDRAMDPGCPTV